MKKLIVIVLSVLLTGSLFAQNTFKYEVRANGGLRVGGSTFAKVDSITSQAGKLRIMSGATLQKIAGHVLYADTVDMLAPYALLSEVGEGVSMVYPGAGIPLSTGSAWGTSITNNSANWNTAYGWGDHSGLYLPVAGTAASVTGFTPASGSLTLSGADALTINTTAASNVTFPTSGTLATTQNINDSIQSGIQISTIAVMKVDSLIKYVTPKQLSDSITAKLGGAVGLTLNGGSITLTGDLATADDITFYTNGNGEYNLPTGGGNLTIQSQVQGWINDSLDVLRTADSDTIPLFVFGAGSGHSSDTALFNNGRLAGAFYNSGSDTLYVTELRGVLVEGTGTETIDVQVSWHVNMKDATATNLNTTALTVISMTTGTVDTTFDNNGIPPGVWVWCTLSGASENNKPTMLSLTMTGYRRNRSY